MSGPYCRDCKHFSKPALSQEGMGECCDPMKEIWQGTTGDLWQGSMTVVMETCTCRNWTERPPNSKYKRSKAGAVVKEMSQDGKRVS